MKKFYKLMCALCAILIIAIASPQKAFALSQSEDQTESVESVTEEVQESTGFDWFTILEYALGILVLAAILAWITHMVYVRFFKKPLPSYTETDFRQLRLTNALPAQATEDENNKALAILQEGYDNWLEDDYGNCWPSKTKYMKRSKKAINAAVELKPTGADAIKLLNELTGDVNACYSRTFYGSKPLLWTVGIVGALMFLITGFAGQDWGAAIYMLVYVGVNIGLYVLACQTPFYLAMKRVSRNSNHASTGLIAGLLGMVAGSTTITTISKWSDGTTTREDDNTEFGVNMFIMIFVFLMLTFFLWALAIWNYLRNYVIYI